MDRKQCFLLSPIKEPTDASYQDFEFVKTKILTPTLNDFQIDLVRSDEFHIPGNIPTLAIEEIFSSFLTIVDITELNPNVFYELAIRHFSKKPCIIIGRNDTTLPFYLRHLDVNYYDISNPESIIDFQSKLRDQIKSVVEGNYSPDDPISNWERYDQWASIFNSESSEIKKIGNLLLDINIDIREQLFRVQSKLKNIGWAVNHPHAFRHLMDKEYEPEEHHMSRPVAYDMLQYHRAEYETKKEAGASERELFEVKLQILKDLQEFQREMEQYDY